MPSTAGATRSNLAFRIPTASQSLDEEHYLHVWEEKGSVASKQAAKDHYPGEHYATARVTLGIKRFPTFVGGSRAERGQNIALGRPTQP